MNAKQKILACYGYLNYRSIAKVVGCNYHYVYQVMRENKRTTVNKNLHRSMPRYLQLRILKSKR